MVGNLLFSAAIPCDPGNMSILSALDVGKVDKISLSQLCCLVVSQVFPKTDLWFYVVTVVWYAAALIISVFLDDLGKVTGVCVLSCFPSQNVLRCSN